VTRKTLTDIADQFQYWLKNRAEKWGAPILDSPDGTGDDSRRDKFLDPYFENAKPNQVVAILKAREPARILVAIGDKNNRSPHLEYKQRWVNQFNCTCLPASQKGVDQTDAFDWRLRTTLSGG